MRRGIFALILAMAISAATFTGMILGSILTIYNAKPAVIDAHYVEIDFGYRVDGYCVE